MSRPSFDAPEWATDTTYPADAGPDASGNTKIAPPGAYTAMGFRRDNPALAQYINDLHNKQGAWLAYWQQYFSDDSVDMTTTDGAFEGALLYTPAGSDVPGWYFWTATPLGTADGSWLVDSPGGQWVSMVFKLAATGVAGHIATVGVVPGITGSADNKILKSVVPFGYLKHTVAGPAAYSTASTSEVTLEDVNMGTLAVGDVVEFSGSAVAKCGAPYSVGTYVTQNGGTKILVTPGDGVTLASSLYNLTASEDQSVAVAFAHTVTVAGTFHVLLKGMTSNGADTLNVTVSKWMIKVSRP